MAAAQPSCAAGLIDTHLHVWSDGAAPFGYDGPEPPEELRARATVEVLLGAMDETGVRGALIVQPINHKFDHSYVLDAMSRHPGRLKGMALANPALPLEEAVAFLQQRHEEGFCGVRFNPGLWPEGRRMTDDVGRALYHSAGEMGMVVGFMCFKGLNLFYDDIVELLEASPSTTAVVDHWGFPRQDGSFPDAPDSSWARLLSLARFPQVYVKASALFRVSGEEAPYRDLKPRLAELVEAFGARRIMLGSDFPFVQTLGPGYKEGMSAVPRWVEEDREATPPSGALAGLTDDDVRMLVHGTAESVFGEWGAA